MEHGLLFFSPSSKSFYTAFELGACSILEVFLTLTPYSLYIYILEKLPHMTCYMLLTRCQSMADQKTYRSAFAVI